MTELSPNEILEQCINVQTVHHPLLADEVSSDTAELPLAVASIDEDEFLNDALVMSPDVLMNAEISHSPGMSNKGSLYSPISGLMRQSLAASNTHCVFLIVLPIKLHLNQKTEFELMAS